jgi:DNA-binding NarL/FixJ family response regulator
VKNINTFIFKNRADKLSMAKVNVVIADPCPLTRAGIAYFLKKDKRIALVGEAENGRQLIQLIKRKYPDIVLMEIEMPLLEGNEALFKIKKEFSQIKVIILSQYFNDEYVSIFMARGANAYLPKLGCTAEILQDCVHTVLHKNYYYRDDTFLALLREFSKRHLPSDFLLKTSLTKFQINIIKLMTEGLTSKKIADTLNCSIANVNKHKIEIFAKAQCCGLGPLTKFALRTGIITLYEDKYPTKKKYKYNSLLKV